jgi:hypothetical protein
MYPLRGGGSQELDAGGGETYAPIEKKPNYSRIIFLLSAIYHS